MALVSGARRRILALAVLSLVAAAGTLWWLGGRIMAPNLHPVGPPPVDLPVRPVAFRSCLLYTSDAADE